MRRRIFWIPAVIALLCVAGYVVAAKQQFRRSMHERRAARTAVAFSGTIVQTLRLSGRVSAKVSAVVFAPAGGAAREFILIKAAASGKKVRRGEPIAELSTPARADEFSGSLPQSEPDIDKLRAEQAAERTGFEQMLRVAETDFERARLDARATALLTAGERELLALSVEEAGARYQALKKEAAFRRQADEAELKMLEITAQRYQLEREQRAGERSYWTIDAPATGVVAAKPVWRDGTMGPARPGDRIRAGETFLEITDPDRLEIEAYANQTESGELRPGEKAEIRLDAFPDVKLAGRLESIGALAMAESWQQNYYVRRVPVRFAIEGEDPRLAPDLAVSVDIEIAQSGPSVIVPLAAVHPERNGTIVYIKEGNHFARRAVKLGLSDNTRVAVLSGLRAGERVRVN